MRNITHYRPRFFAGTGGKTFQRQAEPASKAKDLSFAAAPVVRFY
jgi:hypothetical protein